MARGTALSTLRTMLKAEIGVDITDGVSAGSDAALNQALSQKQQLLLSEYYWPFLEVRDDVNVNSRYANLPTTISFEAHRPRVLVEWNSFWHPIGYGIDEEELNHIDSDAGATMDPIRRWRFASATQFEVWPLPVSLQIVRFIGQAVVDPMTLDAHTCVLDDILLVLFCAADKLARLDATDARLKLEQAQRRLARLLGAYPTRRDCYSMEGPGETQRRVTVVTPGRVGGSITADMTTITADHT